MQFGGEQMYSWNIRTPLCSILARIARDFFLLGYLHRRKSSKRPNFFNGDIKQWRTIGFYNLNSHEGEDMAFIEQRSFGALQWRQFWLLSE